MSLRGGTTKQSRRMYEREEIATLSLAMTWLFLVPNVKTGCHGEPVEPWWAGLCARVFDKLRLTGLLTIVYRPSTYLLNSVSYITLPTWLMAFTLSLLAFTENDMKPCSEAWNLLYGIPAVTGVSSEPAPEIN